MIVYIYIEDESITVSADMIQTILGFLQEVLQALQVGVFLTFIRLHIYKKKKFLNKANLSLHFFVTYEF